MGQLKRWYNSDEAVKRINRQYKKAKKKWQANPLPNNLAIFKRMASQVQEVKRKSRKKYWAAFLQTIDHQTPPAEISRKVKIVHGGKAKQTLHPNPTKKCKELMDAWAQSASEDYLPISVRRALAKSSRCRLRRIKRALS